VTTRVITEQGDRQITTAVRRYSAAKAPVVALADYMKTLVFPISGGNHTSFVKVLTMKAPPEEKAAYPSAAVFPEGSLDYGESDGSIQPTCDPTDHLEDGGAVFGCGELTQSVSIHIWTQEEPDRDNVLMALEDAFNPSPDALGLTLEMEHYHGLRATFGMERVTYEDSPDDNQFRYRKLILSVKVHSPVARIHRLPRIKPRAQVEVSGQV